MNTILVPPALPVERRNSRFVSLRVSRFCSVLFSARATSQEVMFTSLTEKLTYLTSSIYNYRPCSRWGPAHHPSTKGSPCFCAKMRPSMLGRKGILKDSSNVHVMSKLSQFPIPNSSNNNYSHTYRQTQRSSYCK